MSTHPFQELMNAVVDGGYCIGCGLCAAVERSPVRMRLDEDGAYQPALVADPAAGPTDTRVLEVCPFTGQGPDEDDLASSLFAPAPHRGDLGYHLTTYAGYAAEGDFRAQGSSGGMAKWLLAELLEQGLVDRVLQVRETEPDAAGPALFEYGVDDTVEGVHTGSRAAYHPVEMSQAIEFVRAHPGRYVITGVPCFIKGIRRLAVTDPVIAERVRFTVGIICGHLKTTGYAESLAWQLGIPPQELAGIDFRTKLPGRTAREKGVTAYAADGRASEPRVVQDLVGTKYPYGFFKYSACNFCDDVLAETADVAVGDAWLPEYVGSGNSVVVVRSEPIRVLLEDGRAAGRLHLEHIDPDRAAATQAGGLRDRRQGLSYRLHLTRRAGRWHPPKRVTPSNELALPTRLLYRLRMEIPRRSIAAFRRARVEQDLHGYLRRMRRWTRLYDFLVRLGRLRTRVVRLLDRGGHGGS